MAQYDESPPDYSLDYEQQRALIDAVRRSPALVTPTQGSTPRARQVQRMPTYWGSNMPGAPSAPGYDPNAIYGLLPNQRSYNALPARGMANAPEEGNIFTNVAAGASSSMPTTGLQIPQQPAPQQQPAQRQALPMALAARTVVPGAATAAAHQQALDMALQAINRQTQQPDMTAQIDANMRRANAASNDIGPALMMQSLGGQEFAPFSGHVLEQAIKARQPEEVPGGWGTIHRGQFTANEYKQREAEVERLTKTAVVLEQRAHNADTLEQKEILTAEANELKWQIAQMKESGSGGVHLQREGTTPDGRLVVFHPTGPLAGKRTVDGVVYNGPVMGQGALDKQAEVVQKALGSINSLKGIDAMVAANPNAFGGVATLSSLTPQIIAARWQSAKLTPQEREVRALVMTQAAQVINDLYGAAVSAGEMGRAVTFVPTNLDDPLTVSVKLKAAMAWANSKSSEYGQQVRGTAEQRMGAAGGGGGAAAPATLPPGVTVTERVR